MPVTPMSNNPWDEILARVENKVSRYIFHTWFRPTRFLDNEGETVTVLVPDDLFKQWLTRHYSGVIKEATDELGRPETVISLVTPAPADGAAPYPVPPARADGPESAPPDGPESAPPDGSESAPPDGPESAPPPATRQPQRYTFEKFVVGPSNHFAHSAARAVAEAPARSYNPLFIHGGVGLGKTHLMHAIGEYLDVHSPRSSRTYISSDRFMNEMINAIRFDRTIDFRARYRSTDILLVDDIQFLASREGTQIEFFHTFNSLYDAQKQIVISSDRPPRELQFLDDRLRSRFEWGLTADIQPPDLETRVAILKKKADHLAPAIPIPDDVALYIAERIKSNIRELEGSLTTLIARASLWRRPISLPLAQEVLPNLGERDKPVVTIEIILKHVASHYSLKVSELKARNNRPAVVLPRQIAMYLARTLTGASFPEIARKFGKHHSTVLYAYDKVESKCKKDANFNTFIDGFVQSISKPAR